MGKTLLTSAVVAGLAATSAYAATVQLGTEQGLYDILKMTDTAAVNAAQTGTETWAASPLASTLIVEVAGAAVYNEFGWYDSSLAVLGAADYHPIFVGSDGAGATANISFTGTIGFYLKTTENQGPFYSEASRNPDSPVDHLYTTLVSSVGATSIIKTTYGVTSGDVLAWEDRSNGDFDYNDMVLTITPVPEPSTYVAGGLALLPLLLGLRSRLGKI